MPALEVSVSPAQRLFEQIADVHRNHLQLLSRSHQDFLALRRWPVPEVFDARNDTPYAVELPIPAPETLEEQAAENGYHPSPNPLISRVQLEHLARGRIADVFGESFALQASYRRQIRVPAPPLLLPDRVMLLEGEPGSMKTGRVVTETDVVAHAGYVHSGRMSPGVLIESSHSNLLLLSWLGADALLKGERVARLLGCDVTFHSPLPEPGETVRYDIRIDAYAGTKDISLFFFEGEAVATGNKGERKLLSMQNAQGTFSTMRSSLPPRGEVGPGTRPACR
jgi:hypothetical protein